MLEKHGLQHCNLPEDKLHNPVSVIRFSIIPKKPKINFHKILIKQVSLLKWHAAEVYLEDSLEDTHYI